MDEDAVNELCQRLRRRYLLGVSVPDLIRGEPALVSAYPVDIMPVFMRAFRVGLSDVSCIDGWWPPDADGEVSDQNLHIFISDAIEERRAEWLPLT